MGPTVVKAILSLTGVQLYILPGRSKRNLEGDPTEPLALGNAS